MAREVLYRRSFHCDRDLRGMENMFDLDQALMGRKAPRTDRRMPNGDGFEAPRNSLDVPSGVADMRKNSEDVPVGYELSRSLTVSRKAEESFFKPLKVVLASDFDAKQTSTPKMLTHGESERKQPRTPSVVARLMGLDAMPSQELPTIDPSRKISGEKHTSNHSSSRLLMPQEFCPSQDGRVLSKQTSVSAVPSQRDISVQPSCGDCDAEKVSYGELPFRNHPQEKQLQQFKKEFAARQALRGRDPQMLDSDMKSEWPSLDEKLAEAKQSSVSETLHESKEFFDALDFLHANKEFFVKVLNDPNSLFAKNLQRIGPSAKEAFRLKSESPLKGSRFMRSFSESRKEPPISPSFSESRRKQELEPKMQGEKISEWQAFYSSKFGSEDEMPTVRCQAPAKYIFGEPKSGNMCDQMPTRIVVLKPNPGKYASGKPSGPSSPLPRSNVNFKMRVERKAHEKAIFQDSKERVRNSTSKKEVRAAKEMARDQSKDGLKDPRDIAREIVKQVKDDMGRKLLKENSKTMESSSLTRSSSTGRRSSSALRVGIHGDMSGTSDGEGYCIPSRRNSFDNGKSYSSLPSSPRLHRHVEEEHKSFKKATQQDHDSKRNSPRSRVHSQSPRDISSRGDADAASEFSSFSDSFAGVDANTSAKSFGGKKAGSQLRNNSVRETECTKGSSPNILPRSLSVPTAANVENRLSICERKDGGAAFERVNSSSKSRSAENSLFKGRLMSLKDSFSLSKRKSSKKENLAAIHCSSSEPSEIASPRKPLPQQENALLQTKEEPIPISDEHWEAACVSPVQEDPQKQTGGAMDRCLNEILSDNNLTPIGLHQCTPISDAVDTASDTSLDKCEQPSPVSVLETPFQEESPSPEDFRENDSKELRLELPALQSGYNGQLLELRGVVLTKSTSRHFTDSLSANDGSLVPCNRSKELLESFSISDVACPAGKEDELTYIRDIFVFSGFTRDGTIDLHALSPHQGLNPSTFRKLEQHYHEKQAGRTASILSDYRQSSLDSSSRRLLFDAVDEILSKRFGKPINQSLSKPAKPSVQPMRTGKQLLEQIWADIIELSYESQDESLDDLASRDLAKAASWVHSQLDLELLGMELERLIYRSLVEELVQECKAQ